MKKIKIINREFRKILDDFIIEFKDRRFHQTISNYEDDKFDANEFEVNGCTQHYLNRVLDDNWEKYGYPREFVGVEMTKVNWQKIDYDFMKWVEVQNQKIVNFLGSPHNALIAWYPSCHGRIGWHHNGNAPGYNLILTYNDGTSGYFKHYDHKTKKTKVFHDDPKDWTLKAGYFGDLKKEPDKIYWHCAKNENDSNINWEGFRITISFIMNDKNLWREALEEIEEL